MEKNWQHRFIERHPLTWWLIKKVLCAVVFVYKVWLSIAVMLWLYLWVHGLL